MTVNENCSRKYGKGLCVSTGVDRAVGFRFLHIVNTNIKHTLVEAKCA